MSYYYRKHNRQFNRRRFTFSTCEEDEVNQLVDMFREMGFTRSAEIGRYIRKHRLGYRFPNISGFLELSDGSGDCWEFEGGIKPEFYSEICRRLRLGNQGSHARVVNFESYNDRQMYLNI